jgi:GNAT superfamily N-acetyltransferase
MNARYRKHLIRKALKAKKPFPILADPVNLILFAWMIARSIVLRLVPRCTRMYFIRGNFADSEFALPTGKYDFKIFSHDGEEIKEFVANRCQEDRNHFVDSYSAVLSDRFSKGIRACAILDGKRVISMLFAFTRESRIEQLNYTYTPRKNEVLITDIYTLSAYRKKGLYSLLLKHTVKHFNANGKSVLVMWIMKHNRATIQAQLKLGFREIFQTVSMFSWFGFRRTTINASPLPLDRL